jgi:O-antigen/teichoic acid export membrane protein
VSPTAAEEAVAGAAAPGPSVPRFAALRDTDTTHAVGLAAATMIANAVALAFTVVLARLLGTEGYGSLAALISLTIVLFVPGSALQVAAAREGTLGRLGRGRALSATLARWTRQLLLALVAVSALAILAREPLAALLNVDQEWAAAAVPATGVLWLLLSVQRGLLQAAQSYRALGVSIVVEALGRLAAAVVLVGAGLDVTGAYLGTLATVAMTAVALGVVLRRRLGPPARPGAPHPLSALARDAAIPIAILVLLAALQNFDVIVARHVLSEHLSGLYAAAGVAAKALIWIAIGLGMWVLPEATRRAAAQRDPRPVLAKALALIAAIAVVAISLYATVPKLVLRAAFGAEYEPASSVLATLGAAYALLACTFLAAQFLLGLGRRRFGVVLAAAAIAGPLLLLGADGIEGFAMVVLGVQAVAAAVLLTIAARTRAGADAPATRS